MKPTRDLSLVFGAAFAAHCGLVQALDYSQLVSFWALNGNVSDNFSTNNGTFVGTTSYGPGPLANTEAASLDGHSFINVGTNIAFDANVPFSATAWINGSTAQLRRFGHRLPPGWSEPYFSRVYRTGLGMEHEPFRCRFRSSLNTCS